MLPKLIKNDFKSTYTRMLMTFAVFTLLCIIIPLVIIQFQKTAAILYVSLACSLGTMALFILTFVFLFVRYNSNLYSNEGYLMFTLPTKGRNLLLSKLITSFIWITIATVIAFVSIGVMFYAYSTEPEIARVFSKIFGSFQTTSQAVVLYIIEYILGTFLCFMELFFAITVSKLPLWHKCGVLMGFVTFFVINIMMSIPNWFYQSASNQLNELISETVKATGNITIFSSLSSVYTWSNEWLSVLTSVIFCVLLFVGTTLLIEKKTSLK
jgi:hypothetical protein